MKWLESWQAEGNWGGLYIIKRVAPSVYTVDFQQSAAVIHVNPSGADYGLITTLEEAKHICEQHDAELSTLRYRSGWRKPAKIEQYA